MDPFAWSAFGALSDDVTETIWGVTTWRSWKGFRNYKKHDSCTHLRMFYFVRMLEAQEWLERNDDFLNNAPKKKNFNDLGSAKCMTWFWGIMKGTYLVIPGSWAYRQTAVCEIKGPRQGEKQTAKKNICIYMFIFHMFSVDAPA